MKFLKILKKPIFISKLSKRQLISLASLLIILISLPLAIFLTQQRQVYRGRAVGPEARPTRVRISNLHGGGFSASWTSSDKNNDDQFVATTGWVRYGTSANNLDQTKYDDRPGRENFSSATHHVSIFNLNAETTYYFKIKSGPYLYGLDAAGDRWVRGGAAKERKTPRTLELTGNPRPIYGFIKNKAGDKVGGALVYVRLKKDDSDTKSAWMSTVNKANEGWVMDAKNARGKGLRNFFDFDNNDRVLIDVQAAREGIASADFALNNSSPAPNITLTVMITPTPTEPPTETPTPTPTATPTPTPTPCSYKVCEGMACVTKEKNPPCPPDVCSTDTECVCSYKVCEGTSCVSKTQAPPCPPDVCSTDTECATPQANLTFKIKFQGIAQQKPDKTVRVILKQGDQEKYSFDLLGVSSDQNGVYSGNITGIEPGTYDIYIKGWAHLQKKFTDVILAEGNNNQDWSGTALLAGDADGSNRINIQDIRIAVRDYIPNIVPNSPANFNLDDVVSIQDIRFIVINYLEEGE